jgi:ribonuclease G
LSNELVINSTQEGERIALLQDKRLIEYHFDRNDTNYSVGDIFLGTVKKVMPGLNAAFVDIGYEKDAFLHYGDLGEQFPSFTKWARMVQSGRAAAAGLDKFTFEPPLEKVGKAESVFKKGQQIVVQIIKEPISTKGPPREHRHFNGRPLLGADAVFEHHQRQQENCEQGRTRPA